MLLLSFLAAVAMIAAPKASTPFLHGELIFPPQPTHNHGSCIVELPNGDLLASWYRGSGERTADDVAVMGARLKKGSSTWTPAFTMADTPGFPDTNACMFIDPQKRLWLLWSTILDNHWESALTKYKISTDYLKDGPPKWGFMDVMQLKPGPEFKQVFERDIEKQWEPYLKSATPERQQRAQEELANLRKLVDNKLSVRLGWMLRVHPFVLDGKRLIVPTYSDGFDFSMMAITDDWGATWQTSEPIVGPGNVQPSIVQRRDGTLVAYFRDNGPPPQRAMISELKDRGQTWSPVHDTDRPDPGAGLEALVLKSGRWLLINNDTENGRHSLAVSVSEDEGQTWKIVRHVERDEPGKNAGSYSYPSLIQAKDGTIHATYSYDVAKSRQSAAGKGETIKHVHFNEAWLLEGDKMLEGDKK